MECFSVSLLSDMTCVYIMEADNEAVAMMYMNIPENLRFDWWYELFSKLITHTGQYFQSSYVDFLLSTWHKCFY